MPLFSQVKTSCVVREKKKQTILYRQPISVMKYNYNEFGIIISLPEDVKNSIKINYDSLGRIINILSSSSPILEYNYDKLEFPEKTTIVTTKKNIKYPDSGYIYRGNWCFLKKYYFNSANVLVKSTSDLIVSNNLCDSVVYSKITFINKLYNGNNTELIDTTYTFNDNGFLIKYSPRAEKRHPVFVNSYYTYNDKGLLTKILHTMNRKEYNVWRCDSTIENLSYNCYGDIVRQESYLFRLISNRIGYKTTTIRKYIYKYDRTRKRVEQDIYPKGIPIEMNSGSLFGLFDYHIILPKN